MDGDSLIATASSRPSGGDAFSLQTWQRLAWAFIGIGVFVRLVRYLLVFPLWGDECMLAENFLTRDYLTLLKPLDYCQIAPPLYLWMELAVVKLLGFSELSLRLVAIVGGVASLLLFRHVASRLLSGASYAMAVAFLAVAYFPMRHSAEVKPYATDLLAAVVLFTVAVEWWTHRENRRWYWLLLAATPLMLFLSFPAVFIAGGIGATMFIEALRTKSVAMWKACVGYGAVLAASFLIVLATSASGQNDQWGGSMRTFWLESFPPAITQPWALLKWLVAMHTGSLFAYPIGSKGGGSIVTAMCCLSGVVMLARRRAWWLPMVLVPFGLAFIAAALSRYPYGDCERLTQYLGPPVCLLAGLGAANAIAYLRTHRARRTFAAVACTVLGMIAIAQMARDLSHPYKNEWDRNHRGFCCWLWNPNEGGKNLAVIPVELNRKLYPEPDYPTCFCYREICAEQPIPLCSGSDNNVKPDAPLDCVVFHGEHVAVDEREMSAWLERMQATHQLKGTTSYRVKIEGPNYFGYYDVYHFEPRKGASKDDIARDPKASPTR